MSIRTMTRRMALLVTALMVGASIAGSGMATEAPVLTDEDVDRFLDTWLPRLEDGAFMADYLTSEEQMDDGFASYAEPDRVQLIYRLVDAFEAQNASMAEFLDQEGLEPEMKELRRNLTIGIMYFAVFDKPRLLETVEALKSQGGDEPTEETRSTDYGESEFFADMTVDEIMEAFEKQELDLQGSSAQPEAVLPSDVQVPGLDEATQMALDGTAPKEELRYLMLEDAEPATVGEMALPSIEAREADLLAMPALEVEGVPLPELPRGDVDGIATMLSDLLQYVVDTVSYRVCWSYAGGPQQCTVLPSVASDVPLPMGQVPAPLGAPTPIDVDGDSVPDVTVTLAPAPTVDPDTLNPGVQVLFRVEVINVMMEEMPLEITAHYQIPGPPESPAEERPYAVIGYASDNLPRTTALTVGITDILSPEVDVSLDLLTADAGAPLTLIGGTYSVRLADGAYEAHSPSIGQATLDPVPATLGIEFVQDHQTVLEGGAAVDGSVLDVLATASEAARVDVVYLSQQGSSGTVIQGTIDALPPEASVHLFTTPATTTLDYEASDGIGVLDFAIFEIPDFADVSVHEATTFRAEDIPTELSVAMREEGGVQTVAYDAKSAITSARFRAYETEPGQALPTRFLQAEMRDIPTSIDLVKDDRSVRMEASAPIGEISFLRWDGVGQPVTLAGDHVLDLTRTAGGARFESTSARISGLQRASFEIRGDTAEAEVGLSPGGQPFTALLIDETDTGTHTTAALVSNLPRDIRVAVRDGHIQYGASDVVDRLTVGTTEEATSSRRIAVATVDQIPTALDIRFNAGEGSMRYEASSRIPQITFGLLEEQGSDSTLAVARVVDLPREVRVGWDQDAQELFYETSERLGLIEARMVERKGGSTQMMFARAIDLPTRIVAGVGSDLMVVDADAPVGSIQFAAANYDGWLELGGDHALVVDDGQRRSLSFRISGIQRAAIDLDARKVDLDFQGGQAFTAAFADRSRLAFVTISNVPRDVSLDFADDAIVYRASDRIQTVVAFLCEGTVNPNALACLSAQRLGFVRLTDVPTDIRVQLQKRGTVDMAVTMDSQLGAFEAGYSERGFIPALGGGDYVVLLDGAKRAIGARISGFQGLSLELGGAHMELDMQAGTPLTAQMVRDNGDFFYARLSNLPGRITIDLVLPNTVTYRAESVINQVDVVARLDGKVGVAQVQGVPRLLTLDWDIGSSGGSSQATYHASSSVQRIMAQLYDGQNFLFAEAIGVPRTMSVRMESNSATFNSDSNLASLGFAMVRGKDVYAARITNLPQLITADWGTNGNERRIHVASGMAPTSIWFGYSNDGILGNPWFSQPVYPGAPIYLPFADHGYFHTDGNSVRASMMISGLRSLTVRQVPDKTTIDASFVGGQTVTFDVAATDRGQRWKLNGYLTNFPSNLHLELGEEFVASMDRNANVYLRAEVGPEWMMWAVPEPYVTHGVVVRAASLSPLAAKATVFLTGLPTYVRIDPSANDFEFQNFRPSYNYLAVDAQVGSLSAYIYLASPPNDASLRFGQADKRMTATYSANRDSGRLFVDVVDSTGAFLGARIGGRLDISNIPRYISFGGTFKGGGVDVDYSASRVISSIFAGVRQAHVGHFQGWLLIRDIPTSWYIRVNDNSAGAPFMSYRANSDSLDIFVSIDPGLFPLGPVTRVYGALVDIGRSTDFFNLGGGKFRMQSWPYTRQIYLSADAKQPFRFYDSDINWASFYWYWYYADINLNILIDDFTVYGEYLRGLTLKPGLAVKFESFDVNYFVVGLGGLRLDGHAIAVGQLYVLIWPVFTVAMAHFFPAWMPIPMRWDVWNSHWSTLLRWSIVLPLCYPEWHWGWSSWVQWHCLRVTVQVDANPHYHRSYYSWWGGGFALWREESSTQYVFINPQIPIYINGWSMGIPWWLEWAYMTFSEGGIRFSVSTGWT